MTPDDPGGSAHDTDFAAMWSSDGVTRSFAPTATGVPVDLPFLFAPGQTFGPYRIVRPIGKGGMGQVYEAEESDSGRRVAVKILSRGLGDEEERERFLTEGQLAASLSHPNCVYVFGTSEVQGFPVIAMELAPAGTLKDLVVPGTPMPIAKAVDAIVQVIAGLEAAAAIGILHRDIKPSNCFVDRDGRVMVGDFGLSITTLAKDERTVAFAGTILGTPGFASPEQLRGDALDLRSDIYSVGATLYYLLSGRAPFDDPNIATMITRVATEPPPAIALSRPDVPPRLASVVAKCLAKKPADRHATYAALSAALEPFRSAVVTPAPLGRRLIAGIVDTYAASLPLMPFNMFLGARILSSIGTGVESMLLALPTIAGSLLYYTILEGRFGCAAGKALFNLRVVDGARGAPGMRRAFLRAFVFIVPGQIVTQGAGFLITRFVTPPNALPGGTVVSLAAIASVLLGFACLAVLFSTVRRANGFAAIHDLASGTRVVLRPKAIEARQAAPRERPSVHATALGSARVGPYIVPAEVKAAAAAIASPVVVHGFDDRLRRAVWIELLPCGTPPVPAWRRDLGRPARARWISGRRTETECWDAYEAMEGRPLRETAASPQPWARVRHWVADLAQEIAAGSKDGSLPALTFDRVWIGADDRARLLDWPAFAAPLDRDGAPSARQTRDGAALTNGGVTAPTLEAAQRFLYSIAAGALRGIDPAIAGAQSTLTPIPLPARALLRSLDQSAFADAGVIDAQAAATLRDAAVFPSRRRLTQLVAVSLMPAIMALAVFAVIKMQVRARNVDSAAFALDVCLKRLVSIDRKDPAKLTSDDIALRESIEVYIAEYLREGAEDTAGYARAFPAMGSIQREYRMAERALANHPTRTPDQVRRADAAVAKLLADNSQGLTAINRPLVLWQVVAFIAGIAACIVAVFGLIAAFAARGGITMRAFGAALVTADGRDASRLRALLRAAIAFSPVVIVLLTMKYGADVRQGSVTTALLFTLPLVLFAAGAFWAWRHPSRGIQDRVAGTWIVPR